MTLEHCLEHLAVLACAAVVGWLTISPTSALATMTEDTRSRALEAITDTADKICGSVPTSGENRTVEVKGTITTALGGLSKKLIDLGISGAGELKSTAYQGIVQAELPKALNDMRGCKIHIFDILQEKFLPVEPRSDAPSVIVWTANLDNNIEAGKPIIATIRYFNQGHEPVYLNNFGDPFLSSIEQWESGYIAALAKARALSCSVLPFNNNTFLRIAYPTVIYDWHLTSDDATIDQPKRFVATEDFVQGKTMYVFLGCLVYKEARDTHHNAFCFYHRMKQPTLFASALSFCPWGQEVN